jgi:hypothetical protein
MKKSLQSVTMNIKRQYFAAILAQPRRKGIEYRQMKPYWDDRLAGLKPPFQLRLLNGMTPPVPPSLSRNWCGTPRGRNISFILAGWSK